MTAEKILEGINLTIYDEFSTNDNSSDETPLFNPVQKVADTEEDLPFLREANISIDNGEIVTIEGKENVGKSAFLKTLSGRNPLKQGDVIIRGQSLTKIRNANNQKLWRLQFANLVSFEFLDFDNVKLNLELPLLLLKVQRNARNKQISRILEIFQLAELSEQKIYKLTPLEILALSCARSLIVDPAIILIDDPVTNLLRIFDNLDQNSIYEGIIQILTLFEKLNRTVLITSREEYGYKPTSKLYRQIYGKLILS